MYKHFVKRLIDIVLSSIAIVVLAIPMLIVAVIIKIDSPGPVLFKQKRIGIHKKTFTILKFRSMPTTVSKDIPTHMFAEQDALSKWQRFMRKASIDELPQLFNIFMSSMSFCGPRPALWCQEDLIAERDKYGANDVKPGLTGWAQINGRDELSIPIKAQFDGEYASQLNAGHFKGFIMDCRCFFGTILSVLKADGVVEGSATVQQNDSEEESAEEEVLK
ncbi:MAG: sugar transferase [Candidatus Fimenecus sp.]